MAAVSETIVREYFELHGFFVRQQRKYVAAQRGDEEDIDFLVQNPHYDPAAAPAAFELTSPDLAGIARALIEVRGWHTEIFSPAVLERAPQMFRFVEPAVVQPAARAFGPNGPLMKLLVIPGLPRGAQLREQSIQLLRAKGVDAVIPFRTILADLIAQVEVNRNYIKSDLLQTIRILKNYDFIKEPQLELFRARRKRKRPAEKSGG